MVAAIEDGVKKIEPDSMSIKFGNISLTVIVELGSAGSFVFRKITRKLIGRKHYTSILYQRNEQTPDENIIK